MKYLSSWLSNWDCQYSKMPIYWTDSISADYDKAQDIGELMNLGQLVIHWTVYRLWIYQAAGDTSTIRNTNRIEMHSPFTFSSFLYFT